MANRSNPFTRPLYLTDGGLETYLIYQQGIVLNEFAAFELLKSDQGKQALRNYYEPYLELAARYGTGFILETPTWRANPDWGAKLGYSVQELMALNRNAVDFVRTLVLENGQLTHDCIISGNLGPRGDGYKVAHRMTSEEARSYHQAQVETFAAADVDVITAMTINYSDEAMGIIMAAKSCSVPAVISFTVETDGKLPDGESVRDAIEKTDDYTGGYASHFMINCAHPEHFLHVFNNDGHWKGRIKGIRANASTKSHAQLDESVTLDPGDKELLAEGYLHVRRLLPELKVIGGCCGTDHSHLSGICKLLLTEEVSESNVSV